MSDPDPAMIAKFTISKAVSPPEIAERARSILHDEPDVILALLHGSAATGRMRADSDVDIAVLCEQPLTVERKTMLAARLERALRVSVDLIDLFSLNGTILKQVLCKGRVLVRRRPEDMAGQVKKMLFNQADMMPYVRRTLRERQQRFIHG